MPNPWFHVSEEPSTGEPDTTDAPGSTTTGEHGSSAGSASPDSTGAHETGDASGTLGLGSSEAGEAPHTTDTGEPGTTTDPGTTTTDTTGDGMCHDVCGTPGCGECPGEAMVPFEKFSIDPREVNNASYEKFVATNPDPSQQGPACAWNDSFAPSEWVGDGSMPVVNVDWCDAKAYCRWAGKRLCGAIGGDAPTPLLDAFKPGADQWHHACTKGGLLNFPYGLTYNPKACNVHDYDPNKDAVMPTGSLPTCEAPVSGLFDMSGNVWELTDTCEGDGPDDRCIRRGGSYFSVALDLGCYIKSMKPRKDVYAYVGFRCCSQ